jgi:hypothetical protein
VVSGQKVDVSFQGEKHASERPSGRCPLRMHHGLATCWNLTRYRFSLTVGTGCTDGSRSLMHRSAGRIFEHVLGNPAISTQTSYSFRAYPLRRTIGAMQESMVHAAVFLSESRGLPCVLEAATYLMLKVWTESTHDLHIRVFRSLARIALRHLDDGDICKP